MQTKNFKKLMAVTLAAAMTLGSTLTVFADDISQIEGTGTSEGHVDREITAVKLPTASDVANVFDYMLDPEGLIKAAGTDKTGTITGIEGNDDGVYFKVSDGSAATGAKDEKAEFTPADPTDQSEYEAEVTGATEDAEFTYDGERWVDEEGDELVGITITVNKVASGTQTVSSFTDGDEIEVPEEESRPSVYTPKVATGISYSVRFTGSKESNGDDREEVVAGTYVYETDKFKKDDGDYLVDVTVSYEGTTSAATLHENDKVKYTAAVEASSGGSASYASTSKAVDFQGANSVDMTVTVTAKVEGAATDITLVDSEEKLNAATGAALLMNLKVGTTTKAIVSGNDGVSASTTVEGKPDNFDVVANGGKFTYVKNEDKTDWDKATIQLSGKTNGKSITDTTTAPKIVLTWTLAKATADAEPNATTKTYTYDKAADLEIAVSLGGGNKAATDVEKLEYSSTEDGSYAALAKGTKWSYADGKITFNKGQFSSGTSGQKKYLKATFNDTAKTAIVFEITIK